jgi:glutathione S-transferase
MITLHGAAGSPFVRKVRVVLGEKGIAYHLDPLIPFPKTEALLRMSPLGKIPIFEEDGFITPDSSVICAYLERTRPQPPLYPSEPKEFARALWFEEYGDTRLVEAVGPVFFQRFVRPNILGEKTDEALVREALSNAIPPVLDYIESQVGDPNGIVGGRFTIADVAICSPLVNFHFAGESVDATRWPKLARYYATITGRRAFRELLEEERQAARAA